VAVAVPALASPCAWPEEELYSEVGAIVDKPFVLVKDGNLQWYVTCPCLGYEQASSIIVSLAPKPLRELYIWVVVLTGVEIDCGFVECRQCGASVVVSKCALNENAPIKKAMTIATVYSSAGISDPSPICLDRALLESVTQCQCTE
jgi:hypothetical protein